MSKICHEHCPTGEVGGWFWFAVLVTAAAGVVWLVGELLSGLSKTAMVVMGGTAFAVVGLVLVIAVRAAVRSAAVDTTVAATAACGTETRSRTVTQQATKPAVRDGSAGAGATDATKPSSRPRLRLVRGGRAA
jgi:O-antigen ligase